MENNTNNYFNNENVQEAEAYVEATQPDASAQEAYSEENTQTPLEEADESETLYSSDTTVKESESRGYDAPYAHTPYTYAPVYTPPNQPVKKDRTKKILPLMMVTALITSILTSAIFYGLLLYRPSASNQSTIIYRDGNDLRTKVDLMTSFGLQDSENGKPLTVTEIANRVSPTVVGITAQGIVTEGFFGIPQQATSGGTGFIISQDGYIVTNNHVVDGATSVKVTLNNDKEYDAQVIGTDDKTDLAVLKINEKGLTPAVFGNSSDVQVGELAVAIGNPLGQTLSGTVTSGIISATNRKVTVEGNEYTLLQTDAAINSGNSGGPLANAYGEIIGINSAKMASSGIEGLGFAIPSDIAKPVIEDLIAVGYVRGRPLIGLNGRNITEEMGQYYNLPVGIYVISVNAFSGAEAAGIRPGDVVTKCNGTAVATVDELNAIRDQHKAGDTLELTIVRSGETMQINVLLGEDRPSASLN